ncbi:MAG: hypothetical protein Q3X93_07420, partial [Bifidobacterium sp.]|nr:hypothetical protein [Bifidobacterium sp.]
DAQQQYEDNAEAEAQRLLSYLEVVLPTDAVNERATQLVKDIYAKAKYTVGDGNKLQGGDFAVEVTLSPIELFHLIPDETYGQVWTQVCEDNGTTPDPARIDMAMGILGPLEANAPTDACYRIIGLKAMLSLAMGDGEKARELAEQAIGYDASDRFASSVLDRLPETDPAMETANVWENGGHLGR